MTLTVASKHAEMEALCASFPCLHGKPGTMPWDQHAFAKFGRVASSGERYAVQFILSVWNNTNRDAWWKCGTFDAVEAMMCWDSNNQRAFIAWCQDPFFP